MTTLQKNLITLRILALPYADGQNTLDINVCNIQFGCVVLQEQLNLTRGPIGYWFRSLSKAEQAYISLEKCL